MKVYVFLVNHGKRSDLKHKTRHTLTMLLSADVDVLGSGGLPVVCLGKKKGLVKMVVLVE